MTGTAVHTAPLDGIPDRAAPGGVLAVRLITAMLQAAGLYVLLSSVLPDMHRLAKGPVLFMPALSMPVLFIPLILVAVGVPVAVMLGAGRLPARWLTVWAVTAGLLLAVFGLWDVLRRGPGGTDGPEGLVPSATLVLALAGGFFASNVLVTDAVVERRWWPSYALHIDTAWKQGLQAAFAVLFNGLFWAVLAMGAALFGLLNLGQFGKLVTAPEFAIPATTLALALSIHVTDVQPGLIRGARSVILALLSWLLPVLAAILFGFLATLPFTSLSPLWDTHVALALLLGASACLIVLINTAYGDGEAWSGSRIKQAAAMLAALELLPLLGLAATALLLRVGQYGWTASRIFAAAGLVLVGCYAMGYAMAAVARRPRMLETTNHVAAYIGLGLILLLFSPFADPARLAVASQIARLRAGRVASSAFDFAALRKDGERWGTAAADALASGSEPVADAARASRDIRPSDGTPPNQAVLEPEQLTERVKVLPPGRTLPAALLHARFTTFGGQPPSCFQAGPATCAVRFLKLDPDAPEVALLIIGEVGSLLEQESAGHWQETGRLTEGVGCASVRKGLEEGSFELVPHPAQDLVVRGLRLTVIPLAKPCP